MTDREIVDVQTASTLLALNQKDVSQFVRTCVRNRSLSSVVSDLNRDLLFGTEEESEKARRALRHIGFI